MSELKLISPMLDDFSMGEPISDHHGVRCCPAMPNGSDSRYIVKVISIPASQVQAHALLLTGAYPDQSSAQAYYQSLAEDIVREKEILDKLVGLEGFLPIEACQIEPMDDGIGCDIYLLIPYRRSLARHLRKNNLTHLAAVNLGLDICAALATCRQCGYLYTDLKPENIFICNDHEYRIGDLGFLKLDALKFASLPDRYISAYTAPEIVDAYSDVNPTLDIYAAGLVLYQVYNGGKLPFSGRMPAQVLPAPAYADYEMSEIIMKACAPDPNDRWQDPVAMGQALVAYMQRNSVNDTPIVQMIDEHVANIARIESEEHAEILGSSNEPQDDDEVDESTTEQIMLEEFNDLGSEDEPVDAAVDDLLSDTEPQEQDDAYTDADDDELLNLSFLDDLISDDTVPSESMASDFTYDELSSDACQILEQADDLISHDTPGSVVAPEPIDVPIPAPITLATEEPSDESHASHSEDCNEDATENNDGSTDFDESFVVSAKEDTSAETPSEMTEEEEKEYIRAIKRQERKKRAARRKVMKKVFIAILIVALLSLLALSGWIFYKEYYLRSVTTLTLSGTEDQLIVNVDANVDESALTVYCIDTNGTIMESPVVDGKATFSGLNPNTLYKVKVEISGLRKLIGETADSYTTPVQTNIVSFTAVTGTEPGTAVLSFAVNGLDSDTWSITYYAEDEESKSLIFSGHMANISGLTSGKTYTFQLEAGTALYITGVDQIQYTAVDPIFAQNLAVTGATQNSLDVQWETPVGAVVDGWSVRCYNDSGYDKTVTTVDTFVTFNDLDGNKAYTVEVTANGMSSGTRCYMTANAITVKNITLTKLDTSRMQVQWEYEGNTPNVYWILTYSVDGSVYEQGISTDKTSVIVSPYIPGAEYTFTVLLENGTTVFTKPVTLTAPEAEDFVGYVLTKQNITASMCKTPSKPNWVHTDVRSGDYTDTFVVGSKASFVVRCNRSYNTSSDIITTMYVIHDESGKLISNDVTQQTWTSMWYQRYCELDVPKIPDAAGKYSIAIYFNGMFVHSQDFYVVN